MDDLYNNLKVYESEIKGQTSSSSNSQNVAFVSSDNFNNTNETVNTAHCVYAASSKDQASTASYVDDVMFSFFANQSNAPHLDNKDLEQIDVDDLEEMDLKCKYPPPYTGNYMPPIPDLSFAREIRPVWNNAQRVNHQNKLTHPHSKRNFVPTSLATKSGQVPVNAAKQSSLRATASISTSRPVNSATPESKVNDALPITYSYFKSNSPIDDGFVAFGGSPKGGKIRTGVLVTKTECLVLSPNFKLLDESQVFLKVPRQNNMYSFDLKNVVPSGGLTCLFVKATIDESNLWHRRLGHINFKTMNKLVRETFQPLLMLHMDLFGPTSVRSINHKTYCLVVTDDYSRFSWVFFLATKDETSGILKTFITGIENQINHKVKIIRCDSETEFKNNDMNQFCGMKGIKREFSVARTLQQNGVAERKNRTLIKAARTMLADSLLPTTFWAEAVSTACYVQNRVLVTKPHNKTPYELLHGRPPSISFMRPFGCPVTILNTLDPLGKFDEKADEGFFVGYSINSKAFRVFNTRTRKVEENLWGLLVGSSIK
ncbi:putative ribonuclease H-like domain-containing protein [Tanacetum coccineum]